MMSINATISTGNPAERSGGTCGFQTGNFGSDLALYAEPRGVRLFAADVIHDYDETTSTIEANMDRC